MNKYIQLFIYIGDGAGPAGCFVEKHYQAEFSKKF